MIKKCSWKEFMLNQWKWIFLLTCVLACHTKQEQASALDTLQSPNTDLSAVSGDSSQLFTSTTLKDSLMKDTIQLEKLILEDHKADLKPLLDNFKKGDSVRIVCFGNSITHGYKVGSATSVKEPYPSVLEKLLREAFQNQKIQVINEGHNGWRSDQALANLRTLVINRNPDLVILKLGINDAYSGFSPTYFLGQMKKIVELLQEKSIRVILMNPTPILTPFNQKVLAYSPLLRELATQKNISFLNLYQKILDKKDKSGLLWTEVLPDDVHFADNQYRWIAEVLADFMR